MTTSPNYVANVQPSRWDDSQARFYARTIADSDYVENVAPLLAHGVDELLDIGAGSGALGARIIADGSRWHAVEPQPAMLALISELQSNLRNRRVEIVSHPCTWQALSNGIRASHLLAANLGATQHEAADFFDAMATRWTKQMQWVVSAQAGPSTFCLAGFLPPSLHGASMRPGYERSLAQLGSDRAPHSVRFADWYCRYTFPDLTAAQAHFLDRLETAPEGELASEVNRYVERNATISSRGVEVGCQKRSAVLSWLRH